MEITHKMGIPEKLREIKRVTSWQQKEIADKIGVSPKTMSLWINGKVRPGETQERKVGILYDEIVNKKVTKSAVREVIEEIQARNGGEGKKYFTDEEQVYYDAKQYVIEMEKTNDARVYLFPSKGEEEEDSWYKVCGRSLLFYKYYLAPRLGREVNIQDDIDRHYKLKYGIGAARWGNRLINEARNLGYKAEKIELGIIIVELGKKYSKKEIHEFEALAAEERKKLQKVIRPKANFPKMIGAINELARFLPSKISKFDPAYRDIFARELLTPALELEKIYFRMANGRMEKRDAKKEMLARTDDLSAMMMFLDENGFLPMTARTRLGENIIHIRNEVEAEL